MCGEAGMPIGEWSRMKSLRLAHLWLDGYRKRHRSLYEVGWMTSRAAVAGRCKVPQDYPFDLGRMFDDGPDEEMPAMSEEEEKKNLDTMKASLMARMRERAKDETRKTKD